MYEQIQIVNNFKTGREKNLQSFFGKSSIKNIKICLSVIYVLKVLYCMFHIN